MRKIYSQSSYQNLENIIIFYIGDKLTRCDSVVCKIGWEIEKMLNNAAISTIFSLFKY